jgi:hypothetical protein
VCVDPVVGGVLVWGLGKLEPFAGCCVDCDVQCDFDDGLGQRLAVDDIFW